MDKLTLNSYQRRAGNTSIYPGQGLIEGILYCSLGLAGEAGEVAGRVKKILRDDKLTSFEDVSALSPDRKRAIVRQLGDALWYIARLASELDMPLSKVAQMNLDKLHTRQTLNRLTGQGDSR